MEMKKRCNSTVSIHPISSDPGCDMVPKDELDNSHLFLFSKWLFPDESTIRANMSKRSSAAKTSVTVDKGCA
ncbi:hypothetical protein G4B88_018889 [Cannabis sativa]|uniref:Ycf2 N-terminal domain-containing protein n=1 Tax=Cannabis sativa TaxID=3483 RepID=A0A7J6DJT0_CANSA|nr:hypothetical protein G4B88_018889 [Cannabis sativa]